jgi:hypothetical protein
MRFFDAIKLFLYTSNNLFLIYSYAHRFEE